MNETPFEQAIVDLAHMNGWKVASFRTSQQGDRYMTACKYDAVGWPDLTLVHPTGAIVFAEIKGSKGRTSKDQDEWGALLEKATVSIDTNPTFGVHYHLWYPKDADQIITVLTFGKTTRWNL